MSSCSGLHRDLRPQAAGARHLGPQVAHRGGAVKRVPWQRRCARGCLLSQGFQRLLLFAGMLSVAPCSSISVRMRSVSSLPAGTMVC